MKKLVGFSTVPLFSLLVPFLALPFVARTAGAEGWAAISIGQAFGSFGAIAASVGWNLYGPAHLGRISIARRQFTYLLSARVRLIALCGVIPIVAGAAALTAPPSAMFEAAAMAVAMSVGALSPSWYAVATGKPSVLLVHDVTPRILGTVGGTLTMIATSQLLFYPVALAIASVIGYANHIRLVSKNEKFEASGRLVRRVIRAHGRATFTELIATSYSSLSTPVVALAGLPIDDVSRFASGERLYRLALMAVVALSNALQSYVLIDRQPHGFERQKAALYLHISLGVAGGALIASLGEYASALLFGEQLAAPSEVMIWFGLAFAATSVNTSIGRHSLIPAGKGRAVLHSTLVGAVIGLPAIIILALRSGPAGAAGGLALGEAVVLAYQWTALLRLRSHRRMADER